MLRRNRALGWLGHADRPKPCVRCARTAAAGSISPLTYLAPGRNALLVSPSCGGCRTDFPAMGTHLWVVVAILEAVVLYPNRKGKLSLFYPELFS